MDELIKQVSSWLNLANGIASIVGIFLGIVGLRFAFLANKTAKSALKIASFTHMKEIAPNLVLRIPLSIDVREGTTRVYLVNTAIGMATVSYVETSLIPIIPEDNWKFPMNLKQNGIASFETPIEFKLTNILKQSASPNLDIQREVKKAKDNILKNIQFKAYYMDMADTKYSVEFIYNTITENYEGFIEMV